MTTAKHKIVLATWPSNKGWGYFGDVDYGAYDNTTSTFWLSLRAVVPGDKYPYFSEEVRAVSDIGLYCYVTTDGTVSIDLRVHDAGSQTLREAVAHVKCLKGLLRKGKAYPWSDFTRGSPLITELSMALKALGIRECVEYHGIGVDETYAPVAKAVERICTIVACKLASMAPRAA